MTVNKVILIGRLGRDPEIKTSGSGTVFGNLRVATDESRKKDGQWKKHTEWHTVVVFGRTAENAQRYLTKGRQVYIEGRLQTRKWTDKDGKDRWSTEVVCENLRFLGRDDSGGERGASKGQKRQRQNERQSQNYQFDANDVPF